MTLAHPFEWSDYIRLADELSQAKSDLASLRTAISRAYYYVFHLAMKRARMNNFIALPGGASHAQLWTLYARNPDPLCAKLGQMGERLKEKRRMADYEEQFPRLADEVAGVLADALDFARRLDSLPPRFPNPKSVRY